MYQINDDIITIDEVFKTCYNNNIPIAYSGIQGDEKLVKYWKDHNIDIKPFPGYGFGIKKPISEECRSIINNCSYKYNIPTFSRTSCIISYMYNFDKDYNAHYYRPNELNCNLCIMNNKCKKFKENQDSNVNKFKNIIPFDFDIIYKEKHKCYLHDKCKYPTDDCTNINSFLINIKQKITLADL